MKQRLKTKWNIDSDKDFWLIMLTFSMAGMSIMFARKLIFPLLGITHNTPFWIVAILYIPTAFIAYQFGLLFFSILLGQFKFFWEWEKNMLRRLRILRGKNIKH